jgi:soluble lytic murein transglycosylase-like protein
MPSRSRRPVPAWERSAAQPRHPTGRTRRRWPRAYDGGMPAHPAGVNARYRRAFDGDQQEQALRARRRPTALDALRQSPIRNGLIGLAVAGAAAPIAVNRYQTALRTDPSHERMVASATPVAEEQVSDSAVTQAWNEMQGEEASATSERDQVIEAKLAENARFNLTREMAEDIYDMAKEANVDPDIAFGLVRAESSFKNHSTSRVGAIGLTQLMPATARWLEPGTTRDDLRNQETNLRIGFGYLKNLIDKYDGDVDLALTAYNRGPGTVDKALKRGNNPDNGYAKFVKTGQVGSHKG